MPPRPILVTRVTHARRREMQRAYEATGRLLADSRDEEALKLAAQCVSADPDCRIYVERFLHAVQRVVPTQADAGSLPRRIACWARLRRIHKLSTNEDWQGVFAQGVAEVSEPRLSHVAARGKLLWQIAFACRESECFESEMAWLEGAMHCLKQPADCQHPAASSSSANGKLQAAIRRQLADSYTRHGDLAAADALSENTSTERSCSPAPAQSVEVDRLRQAIATAPADVAGYLALAEYLVTHNRLREAEDTLIQARFVEPSVIVVTKLEDVQIAIARHQVTEARKRLADSNNATDRSAFGSAVDRLEDERLRIECEIYRSRRERDANDADVRLQLATCLRELGNAVEAAKELQGFSWPVELQAQAKRELAACGELRNHKD
ncbi:MAG: hypothetical protein MPJ50_12480 [Pirellulales bacterium]|nr:hypothetical protein [Pirellulales bacterium]